MRRFIIIGTAIAMLISASVAYAAFNTYGASIKVTGPGSKGSVKHPVPVGFVESLAAASVSPPNRAAPLSDIKTTIYGLKGTSASFPTCDGPQMSIHHGDSFCPPGALVSTGPVTSILGSSDLTTMGSPCDPFLHVWNGGHGKLWFFFTTGGTHTCGSLKTGDTAAYPGYISQHGMNYVLDVPLPPDVGTEVAFHKGLYGSLIKEVLTTRNLTTKVHGKTVGFTNSIGCLKGKRPVTVSFTALAGSVSETKTVKSTSSC